MSRSISNRVEKPTSGGRRAAAGLLTAAAVAALIAGCGGSSSHSSSTGGATTPASSGKTTINPGGLNQPNTGTSTGSPTPTTTSTSTPTRPTGGAGLGTTPTTASTATGQAKPSNGGSTDARVPATYTIGSGGSLKPKTVSVPAFIAVQLTFSAGDGQAHTVVVQTPTPHTLKVAAGGGPAGVKIPGQKAGDYPITVDGTKQGTLSIGGDAGP